jgi:hypothetical protein
VKRRNEKIIKAAVRSTAIVTSMFPSNVRDRLYKDIDDDEKKRKKHGNLKVYLRDSDGNNVRHTDAPLADLFAETTVLVRHIIRVNRFLYLVKKLTYLFLFCQVCRHCWLYSVEFCS